MLITLSCFILFRSLYERKRPVLTEYSVESKRLPKAFHGKKVLFLSDLHNAVFLNDSADFYRLLENASPDYIFIGGDMMTVKKGWDKDFSALENLLKKVCTICPIYYADGNHELRMKKEEALYPGWYQDFLMLLEKYHVYHLDGNTLHLQEGGEEIALADLTVDTVYYKKKFRHIDFVPGYIESKLGKKEALYTILFCHQPAHLKEIAAWGADLTLSGHYHGGTIRVPKLGGLMSPQFEFFSRYTRGKLTEGNTVEIISGGLGTHSINLRVFNRPEIVSATLLREEDA